MKSGDKKPQRNWGGGEIKKKKERCFYLQQEKQNKIISWQIPQNLKIIWGPKSWEDKVRISESHDREIASERKWSRDIARHLEHSKWDR